MAVVAGTVARRFHAWVHTAPSTDYVCSGAYPGTGYPVGVVWCGAFGVRLRLIFMRIALAYLPIFRAIAKPRLLTLPGDIPPSG